MSISNLYNENDTIIYCGEMHCKNLVPPSAGQQGDIYTVNAANQSIFSKTIDGANGEYIYKNCKLYVLNEDDSQPGILSCGTLSTNTQGAVFGMGEQDTENSFFYYYDPINKELALGQNNACVDKDFTMNLNNGNLTLNNKLKLPTVAGDNILKIDNNNIVTNATSTDFNNVYNNDGTISTGIERKILLNDVSSTFQVGLTGLKVVGDGSTIISGALQTTTLTNGYLYADNSGNITASALSGNLISTYTQSVPGIYNIICPVGAKSATISAVGGGGGGCLNIGFASPGGGAGGGVINYPVSVKEGQTINITVGAGGLANNDGTDTVINIGSQIITCGKGLTSTNQTSGGNGGSVNVGFTSITGGAGGAFQVNGSNGNINFFMYSGAGGGGTRANGGAVLLFTGGIADANYGGGGASILANGGNHHENGSLGSGGGADNFAGGDGYISINFYN